MPYTDNGKNTMLNNIGVTHAALAAEETPKSITGVAATDIFTSAAHGYSNGNLAVLKSLTGGAGLILLDQPYFIIGVTTNTFQLSKTVGGAAVDFSTDVTAGTISRVSELTGGSPAYARKAIAFATAAGGILDDSTNGDVFDVPPSSSVNFALYFDALTAGNLKAISRVTQETFAGQGQYTLTDAKLDLNN